MRSLIFILLSFLLICTLRSSYGSAIAKDEGILNHVKDHVNQAEKDVNVLNSNKLDVKYSDERMGFIHGFLASIYVIIISELGDKTFFIAAIMSIRNPRLIVYLGAMTALASMTVLSAALGMATTVIPRVYTYYISGILFLLFGLKMIKDAYDMSPNDATEEYEEVATELRKRDVENMSSKQLVSDPETGVLSPLPTESTTKSSNGGTSQSSGIFGWREKMRKFKRILYLVFSKIFIEAFVLTFLAEWGDRSQMTTIVLAATKDVVGVILGGTLGHAICTGIAVIAGRFISQKIPVRALTLIGGVTFILFAVHTFVADPKSNS